MGEEPSLFVEERESPRSQAFSSPAFFACGTNGGEDLVKLITCGCNWTFGGRVEEWHIPSVAVQL